jgi:hypothetical protein
MADAPASCRRGKGVCRVPASGSASSIRRRRKSAVEIFVGVLGASNLTRGDLEAEVAGLDAGCQRFCDALRSRPDRLGCEWIVCSLSSI